MPDNAQDAKSATQTDPSLQSAVTAPETSNIPLKRKPGRPKRITTITNTPYKPQQSLHNNKGILISDLIAYRKQGLSYGDIAKIVDCTHVNVINRLKPYYEDLDVLDTWKANEQDFLEILKSRIAFSITPADIKGASFRDRMIGLGILYDKSKTSMTTTNIFNTVIHQVHAQGIGKQVDITPDSVDNKHKVLIDNDSET